MKQNLSPFLVIICFVFLIIILATQQKTIIQLAHEKNYYRWQHIVDSTFLYDLNEVEDSCLNCGNKQKFYLYIFNEDFIAAQKFRKHKRDSIFKKQ